FDPHVVADLTADVYVAMLSSAHTYSATRGSPRAWLFGIARHVLSGHRRADLADRDKQRRIEGRRLLGEEDVDRLVERIDAQAYRRAGERPWGGRGPGGVAGGRAGHVRARGPGRPGAGGGGGGARDPGSRRSGPAAPGPPGAADHAGRPGSGRLGAVVHRARRNRGGAVMDEVETRFENRLLAGLVALVGPSAPPAP